jgi:transcriptional regulator with XRE-family HTH domain
MATVEQALAATLRALREQKGLSQESVSNLVGVKQPTIANWENAARTPSPTYLSSIASAYETTASQIYEKSESLQTEKLDLISKPKKGKHGNSHKNKKKK